MVRSTVWMLLAGLTVIAGCSCESTMPMVDGGPLDAAALDAEIDAFVPPVDLPNPTLVQTTASEEVRAGDPIIVSCTILDENGEVYSAAGRTPTIRFSPSDSVQRMDGMFIAIRTGEVEVSCGFLDLMLTDESPAIVRIIPGPAAEVTTELDAVRVTAGATVGAICIAFDAYGNRITDASPSLRVEPSADGNTVADLSAEMTQAGIYEFSCELDGAASSGAALEVVPALPAHLVAGKVPDQPVYGIGQVIEIATQVTDQYDNLITDAPLDFSSDPAGGMLGRNRFRYLADGVYNVTVQVTGPTQDDIELTAQLQIVVNGDGPQIQCEGPGDGAMIDRGSGTLTFRGSVSDVSGIESVLVNGRGVTVDGGGGFSTSINADFGINFVEIVARDSFGEESSRTCSFLASNRWGDPSGTLNDTVALGLLQEAIDDGDAAGPIDSLDDLLDRVVNSAGLRNSLHSSLVAANPLKPRSCDQRVFGACIFRSRIDYRDLDFHGANVTDLTLQDGGVRAHVRMNDVRVQLEISGTLDTTGWAHFEYLDITMDLATSISAGRPRMAVIPGSVVTSVGRITPHFSGFSGFIVNIVVRLINGTLRSLVRDLVTGYITTSFNDTLDGVLGGLDVDSLGTSFNVPRLDGTGTIPLGFGLAFSTLDTNSSRMRFGIGTRFTGPTAIARPTLGVAIPGTSGPLIDDPTAATSMWVSIHNVMFNQVMHTLWRGGLLEATIGGEDLGGGMPSGIEAEISGALPPVAVMDGENVNLGIGAMTLRLVYPGLFEEPITMVIGAMSSTNVTLVGDDIRFGAITVDELYFSTNDVSLDASTRATLSRFLTRLVQSIVDSALNDALPAIPIPSFSLPASLSEFGVPPGTTLGIRSPSLTNEDPHFVLRGQFGSL